MLFGEYTVMPYIRMGFHCKSIPPFNWRKLFQRRKLLLRQSSFLVWPYLHITLNRPLLVSNASHSIFRHPFNNRVITYNGLPVLSNRFIHCTSTSSRMIPSETSCLLTDNHSYFEMVELEKQISISDDHITEIHSVFFAIVKEVCEEHDYSELFNQYLLFSEDFSEIAVFSFEIYDFLFSKFELSSYGLCNTLYEGLLRRISRKKSGWSVQQIEAITFRFITSLSQFEQHVAFLKGVQIVLKFFIFSFGEASDIVWNHLINTVVNAFSRDLSNQRTNLTGAMALELINAYKYRFPERAATEKLYFWELKCKSYLEDSVCIHKLYLEYLEKNQNTLPTVAAYNGFIQAFAQVDEFDKARELLIEVISKTKFSISLESAEALMRYCVRRRDVLSCKKLLDSFLALYDNSELMRSKFNLYSMFIECCRESLTHGRFDRNTLLSHRALVYRWKVAELFLQVVRSMDRLRLPKDQQCWESILTCYVYANYDDFLKFSISDAVEVLNKMTASGIPVTHYAFHTIMRGFANIWEPIDVKSRPDLIQKYMNIMKSAGLRLDARAYSIYFLSFLYIAEEVSSTNYPTYLSRLKGKEQEMLEMGIAHTHESIHALMRVIGSFQDYKTMHELFERMPLLNLQRTEDTYFTMFKAASKSEPHSFSVLQSLLPLMDQDGVELTETLFHTLLSCCVTCNNTNLAWKLYERLGLAGLQPTRTILNYLLKLSIYNQQLENVQFVLDEFSRRQWFFCPTTYYHLMSYFTNINPDHIQMQLLCNRILDQVALVAEFSEKLQDKDLNSRSNSKATSLGIPFRFKSVTETKSNFTLKFPPISPLPSLDSPVDQHPVPVLSDTRLCLKALQMFIRERNLPSAIKAYSNILTDFHICLLHRYAISQKYINKSEKGFGPFNIPGQYILSYPPKIFEYNPSTSRAGSLYLPEDVAKATWLLCTALLNWPLHTVPENFPPVPYVYIQNRDILPNSHSSLPVNSYSALFQNIRCAYIPLAFKHHNDAARIIFQSSMRVLLSYQEFSTVLRYFGWVRDLMGKLNFNMKRSLKHNKLVLEDDIIHSSSIANAFKSIWDSPNFFQADSNFWKSIVQEEQQEFQSVNVRNLSITAELLGINPTITTEKNSGQYDSDSYLIFKYMRGADNLKATPSQLEQLRNAHSNMKKRLITQ